MGIKNIFRKKKSKTEKEDEIILYPSKVGYHNPKTNKFYKPAYSKIKGGYYEKEVSEHFLRQLTKREKLSKEWFQKIEPLLVEIINNNKEKIDGLKFYSSSRQKVNKLVLRSDGKFNIEYTSTEFGERWPGLIDDNQNKGYTSQQIVNDPWRGHEQLIDYNRSENARKELINEIKKRTNINLRKKSS